MNAAELFQELKRKIRAGELTGKLPSISEMIADYRVSHNTVKKALDMLKMRQIVYGIQGKGVYVQSHARQKTHGGIYIYCALRCLNNQFYIRVLDRLRANAAATDFSIELISNFRDCEKAAGTLGFIMQGATLPAENLVLAKNFREVLGINLEYNFTDDRHIYGCINDNFYGGYKAVEYLYNRGHRRIGVITCGLDLPENIFHQRLRGTAKFAEEHPDITLLRHDVAEVRGECRQGSPGMDNADLLRDPQLTAVFAFTDLLAIEVMNHLREMGRRIPEDVSVIGYDNSVFSAMLSPALTTIEEDSEGMAGAVLAMIRDHLAGRCIQEDILVKPELVERGSVCDIRSR